MFSSNASQVSNDANYIEDVFSTYLYTGNGGSSRIRIQNGVDVLNEGGLVWIKNRSGAQDHYLTDTARGMYGVGGNTTGTFRLSSNTTAAQIQDGPSASVGNSDAFPAPAVPTDGFFINAGANANGSFNYASWTFRKQPKFFDVVTYTGTGSARTVAHNLGSVPGFIIVKRTDAGGAWTCFHRSLANTQFLPLNATNAAITNANVWNSTSPTSTVFTVGTDTDVNASGGTYVAYVFAHDAAGFGESGTDNVVSCGSYTGTGAAGNFVSLGYEPQWLLIKRTNTTGNWLVLDNMRGIATGGVDAGLFPNLSNAEDSANDYLSVNATGFELTGVSTTVNASGSTYIYIAIRRGPMKTPTTGTSVFQPVTYTGTGASLTTTTGINQDSVLIKRRSATSSALFTDRLRGVGGYWLDTASTAGENGANTTAVTALSNTSFTQGGGSIVGASGSTYVGYGFTRAPGFMDVCCFTGTGNPTSFSHNLAVTPELLIVKRRNTTGNWVVRAFNQGGMSLTLNSTSAAGTTSEVTATSSAVSIALDSINWSASGSTYVAYLFASCPGVSKVGSYTGTGTTQQINCGFTGGARFVLIKRTDSTGDWYVWDSARGIVSGNDPYLLLNSTAAEVTSTDYIDTYSAGFEISSTAPAAINASGGSFIFLAIA